MQRDTRGLDEYLAWPKKVPTNLIAHLEKEILAVVWTAVMDHDEVRLHYPPFVAQLDESRHRVLSC